MKFPPENLKSPYCFSMIHKTIIPDKRKVNITFNVPENYVGEEIEIIAFIKKEGIQNAEANDHLFPALPGDPLNNTDFLSWIEKAESLPTLTLEEVKSKWTMQRKELQKLTR